MRLPAEFRLVTQAKSHVRCCACAFWPFRERSTANLDTRAYALLPEPNPNPGDFDGRRAKFEWHGGVSWYDV